LPTFDDLHKNNRPLLENEYKTELRSITKNAGITAFGIFFMNILAFGSNAIITRTLGAETYGLFVLATKMLDFIVVVSTFGFSPTLIKFISFYIGKKDYPRAKGTFLYSFGILAFLSLIIAIVLFFISDVIAVNLFKRNDLSPLFKILIISLPFAVTVGVLFSTMTGLKLIKQLVLISNIINPLFYLIMFSALFLAGYRLIGLMWVQVITTILIFFIAMWVVYKKFLVSHKKVRPVFEKRKLWSFSTPLFFNQLFQRGVQFSPVFIMGLYLTNSDIGIFNISFRIALMVSVLLGAFRLIFAPTISGLFAKRNKTMIGQLFKTTTKWVFTFSLMIFSIIVLFGEPLLSIFGNEFRNGTMILFILATGELISAGAGLVGSIIVMSGRPKIALLNSSVTFALILVLSFTLISHYGIFGVAISYSVSIAMVNILRIVEVYIFEKIHPFKTNYLKPIAAALIAFAIVELLKGSFYMNMYIEMVAGAIVFMLIFALILWLFRLDDEDKYILGIIFGRFKKQGK
jgi:O-antigen/teichoic acid export membrane protein